MSETMPYRTLFLSDVHLGTPDCQASMLIDFLREHEAETIYLVGDIVDFWRMKRKRFYWPQTHNDVIQKLLRQARKGVRIIYIPGNHDEALRAYPGIHFGGVEVVDRAIHETASGKRFLVLHGDEFDMVVLNHRWLAHLGDIAYGFAMFANKWHNRMRTALGLPYWSVSRWMKHKVKQAVSFMSDFEQVLAAEARREGADGVICGHIHHPANDERAGIHYVNTGDWVESCTAVVEHWDGHLELIEWGTTTRKRGEDLKALARPHVLEDARIAPVTIPAALPAAAGERMIHEHR